MMLEVLDLLTVMSFLLATIYIGLKASSNIVDLRSYAIGDRNYSTLVLVATFTATIISSTGIVFSAAESYQYGLVYLFTAFGISISCLVSSWLVAPKMGKYFGYLSIGEIIGDMYGKYARITTGILSVILSISFIGGQIKVVSLIFGSIFGVNIDIIYSLAGFILFFYTIYGGIKAVTFTDLLQFLVLAIIIALIVNVSVYDQGGIDNLIMSTSNDFVGVKLDANRALYSITFLLATIVPGNTPFVIQRSLMAKDVSQIKSMFNISAAILIPYKLFACLLGISALKLNHSLPPNDVLVYIMQQFFPTGVKGIIIVGMLSVVMSTCDTYLNTSAVGIVNDIIKPISKNAISNHSQLKLARIFTSLTGLAAILLMRYQDISSIVMWARSVWEPVITPLFLMGLYGARISSLGFFVSAIFSLVIMISWDYFQLQELLHIHKIFPALVASFIMAVCWWLIDRTRQFKINQAYSV